MSLASDRRPFHVPAHEGESLWVMGDTYTVKARREDTGGSMSLIEASVPPGAGPPPHGHRDEDEAFYVLSGELDLLLGEEEQHAETGAFVFVPRGVVHRFVNRGVHTARLLFLYTPGGFEGYFFDIGHPARPAGSPPPLAQSDIDLSVERAGVYGLEVAWDDPSLAVGGPPGPG